MGTSCHPYWPKPALAVAAGGQAGHARARARQAWWVLVCIGYNGILLKLWLHAKLLLLLGGACAVLVC